MFKMQKLVLERETFELRSDNQQNEEDFTALEYVENYTLVCQSQR
jgi:hypothetical protein